MAGRPARRWATPGWLASGEAAAPPSCAGQGGGSWHMAVLQVGVAGSRGEVDDFNPDGRYGDGGRVTSDLRK